MESVAVTATSGAAERCTNRPACNWGDERLSPLFWQSVYVEPNSGCWLRFGDQQYVSRYRRQAYVTLIGPVPETNHLRSTCGGSCISPLHVKSQKTRTPEEDAEARRLRKKRLPEWKKQRQWLRWRYGLSLAQYEEMFNSQSGACAVCGEKFGTDFKDKARVDHCHESGLIRDLLCTVCNTGLGSFRDRPDLLRAAADYLERHAARRTK